MHINYSLKLTEVPAGMSQFVYNFDSACIFKCKQGAIYVEKTKSKLDENEVFRFFRIFVFNSWYGHSGPGKNFTLSYQIISTLRRLPEIFKMRFSRLKFQFDRPTKAPLIETKTETPAKPSITAFIEQPPRKAVIKIAKIFY